MKVKYRWLAAMLLSIGLFACLPLYAQEAQEQEPARCPHCGAVLEADVQEETPDDAEAVETEAAAAEEGQVAEQATPLEQRLYRLYDAMIVFTQRNYDQIPMNINRLIPLLEERERGLINPETNAMIEMNPRMRGIHHWRIVDPTKFITFVAAADNERDEGHAVIFGDRRIEYLTGDQIRKIINENRPRRVSGDDFDRSLRIDPWEEYGPDGPPDAQ